MRPAVATRVGGSAAQQARPARPTAGNEVRGSDPARAGLLPAV